ncbi:MAG: leucine--tRNA ligase [Actinomycetia bacterium]|nr:leucine--tRNA ligase [Actinomycetes bacterium]
MRVSVRSVYGGEARYHEPMHRYDPAEIEPKWQQVWEDQELSRASDDPEDPRPRFYALDMFPYPSGDLHLGHAEAFSGGDVIARFRWLQGYNVLHPIGWDSFGLPAENAAIKRGIHPKEWTYENIEQQAASFKRMGFSFDWTRRLHSSDPEYYRWTQWLFLKLFEMGLAYRKNAPANWCPNDQTVLANEQVINGACERCGTAVVRKDLTQWFFKITDYAQRLLDDMDTLEEWPEPRGDGRRGRGLHHPPRHPVGRHVLRVRSRAPARREAGGGRRGLVRRPGARGSLASDAAHQPGAGREP